MSCAREEREAWHATRDVLGGVRSLLEARGATILHSFQFGQILRKEGGERDKEDMNLTLT